MKDSARSQLIGMARRNIEVVKSGVLDRTQDVMRVPPTHYYDPDRSRLETDRVFKRLPLLLAMSGELKNPGDFKTMVVCGVPVLIVRDRSNEVRAFINSYSHRGAVIVTDRSGNRSRIACPYHAWTYDDLGDLVAVYKSEEFGDIDKSCHGLTPLMVGERAGLIWVSLDPATTLDIDTFLCGYDDVLSLFSFGNWSLFDHRTIAGPNWKMAYDGYMDLYHLPTLHEDTFGANMSNQALYHAWGPHQRVSSPNPGLLKLADQPEEDGLTDVLMSSVWSIFPQVSIASFDGGGRGVMISQFFPGDTPLESFTLQNYMMETLPTTDDMKAAANAQFKLLEYVVREEDYATGVRYHSNMILRSDFEVMFGRNEGGAQRFHRFLDELLACGDADLTARFKRVGAEAQLDRDQPRSPCSLALFSADGPGL
jgi:nitrite reductase/ring-hydroxylating ferredoxin subunit